MHPILVALEHAIKTPTITVTALRGSALVVATPARTYEIFAGQDYLYIHSYDVSGAFWNHHFGSYLLSDPNLITKLQEYLFDATT